jgi:hypothetical protein
MRRNGRSDEGRSGVGEKYLGEEVMKGRNRSGGVMGGGGGT